MSFFRQESPLRVLPVDIDDDIILKATPQKGEDTRPRPIRVNWVPDEDDEGDTNTPIPGSLGAQEDRPRPRAFLGTGNLSPPLSPPLSRPRQGTPPVSDILLDDFDSDACRDPMMSSVDLYMPFAPPIPSPRASETNMNTSFGTPPRGASFIIPQRLDGILQQPPPMNRSPVQHAVDHGDDEPENNGPSPACQASPGQLNCSSSEQSLPDRLHPVRPSPTPKQTAPRSPIHTTPKGPPPQPDAEQSRVNTPPTQGPMLAGSQRHMSFCNNDNVGGSTPHSRGSQSPPLQGLAFTNEQLNRSFSRSLSESSPVPNGPCQTPPMKGPLLVNGQQRSHLNSSMSEAGCPPWGPQEMCSSVQMFSPRSDQPPSLNSSQSFSRPCSAPPSLPIVVNADFSVPEKVEECIVNVGPIKFLVPTRLMKQDKQSNLQKMMDGEWEDVADDHPDGSFSIDHDPTFFPAVLQILRGTFTFPHTDNAFLKAVLQELEFYNLQKAKVELLLKYPFLKAGGGTLRLDGLYFAIETPSLSALAHDEFNCATPDNVIKAFRFKDNGRVIRYKKHEKHSHVVLVLDDEGTYEKHMLPYERICCQFKDSKDGCIFSRDAHGTTVLEFRQKAYKVVFHPDEELVHWMRLRFPT